MSLFDDRVREDAAYKRTAETMYEFLDRVSIPELAFPRSMLDTWFERWPADDREALRSRLMAKDRANFNGAFWELYLHELHARLGFTIERDPDLPGLRTHPDFLLRRGDTAFYMEATVVGVADQVAARRRREDLVVDAINGAYHPDFALRLYRIGLGSQQPPRRAIIDAVEDWMSTLDWDTEIARIDSPPGDPVNLHVRGTHLFVWPWPRAQALRGKRDAPTVVTRTGDGGIVNVAAAILDNLKDKARKFGKPQEPFVIALLCDRDFATDSDIEQALFGPEVVRVSAGPGGPRSQPELDRDPRGFWQYGTSQRATRVAGVL